MIFDGKATTTMCQLLLVEPLGVLLLAEPLSVVQEKVQPEAKQRERTDLARASVVDKAG
jgi:hypothetical protein